MALVFDLLNVKLRDLLPDVTLMLGPPLPKVRQVLAVEILLTVIYFEPVLFLGSSFFSGIYFPGIALLVLGIRMFLVLWVSR